MLPLFELVTGALEALYAAGRGGRRLRSQHGRQQDPVFGRRMVHDQLQQGRGSTESPPGWTPLSVEVQGVPGWRLALTRSGFRMADFKLNVPRSSVRSVRRSQARLGGTSGVHASRGRLLVNGSADGLVELVLDPPCYTGRTLNTMFVNQKVTSLILSLADPDGFIAAVESRGDM